MYCFLGVGVVHDQCLFRLLICITSFGYCPCPRQGFANAVHIFGTPLLCQLICMVHVYGREGPGVDFKVHLMSLP